MVTTLCFYINPSLLLVQPRKIRPFITERLLMGRRESNQKTNKLCFYLYPIPVFLKTLATISYASLVYHVLHVASPRINEAKYFALHMLLVSIHVSKHSNFSFIALLFMTRLSEHKCSGAIGMLKNGIRVSGVARYNNCHPSTKLVKTN